MLIVIITAAKLRSQIGWSKDQEITDAICDALKKNFVFKGIPENLLLEVRGACMHPCMVVTPCTVVGHAEQLIRDDTFVKAPTPMTFQPFDLVPGG